MFNKYMLSAINPWNEWRRKNEFAVSSGKKELGQTAKTFIDDLTIYYRKRFMSSTRRNFVMYTILPKMKHHASTKIV